MYVVGLRALTGDLTPAIVRLGPDIVKEMYGLGQPSVEGP